MAIQPDAVAAPSTSDAEVLLRRLQPVVRFDSHEAFFCHDVRAMADNPRFRLTRDDTRAGEPGYVIANHAGGLSADFLGGAAYANHMPFEDGDHFALDLGGPDAYLDKIGDYREMERELPDSVRNVISARAAGPDGRSVRSLEGDVWLQYWFFYLYNDAQFGDRSDLHEGDLEMVQFLVHDGEPVSAVFAQHAYAEQRSFAELCWDDEFDCPVVFSARGSHASYFEAGLQRTHVKLNGQYLPLFWDAADGNGPHIRQRLVVLDDAELPGWAQWRGRWGGTKPHTVLDGDSPGGPITHGQWQRPASLAENAIDHDRRPLPNAPAVAVRRVPPGVSLRFDFTTAGDPPAELVLTLRSGTDPPHTETLAVAPLLRGTLLTRGPLDDQRAYTADVSTISAAGMPTKPDDRPIALAPVRPVSPIRPLAAVLRAWDRLTLWLTSVLMRRVHREPVRIGEPTANR